jgi:iron(III) transport system ATP-binding protein
MSEKALSLRNVAKRFGSYQTVDGVSLDVQTKEFVVIVGPSGCGKTTLLRLIAGLEVPDGGEVWIADRHVAGAGRGLVPPYQRRIGFVFQDLALWPHMTVQENLQFVLQSAGTRKDEQRARTREVLDLVRIEPLAGRYPHELSGGEQQRVALARALVHRPQLLLLDEPLSSLDPDLRTALRDELLRLQRTTDVTMVYVTHDREDAIALADRLVEMRAGRIASVTDRQTKEPA